MRSNQTQTAVLGALSIEPMTGYALRQAITEVLGHFWSESFGQIYPALAELERAGHVRRRGTARTGSSTFAITRSGRARLRALLARPVQSPPPRNGLLLRLFFGRHLGPEACRSLVNEARTDAERRLAGYRSIRDGIERETEHADDRPYWLLTVAAGEHAARASLAWADDALAVLDRLHPTPGWPRRPEGRSTR